MHTAVVQRIIIDLDVGTDDAFALLVLLHAEKMGKVKVEAIICTMGNSYLHHVCKNVVRLLEILGRTDIPVYKGVSGPIVPLPQDLPGKFFYHGKDGLGDLEYDKDPDMSIISEIAAPVALNELIMNNPGEITLLCLGPLTNAALTIKIFEKFACNLKNIYVMGGAYKGFGNITDAAEFNFYVDPESANIVLNNETIPVTLVTWETCKDTSITLGWRNKTLGVLQSQFMNLLNRAEATVHGDASLEMHWLTPDVFVVVIMLYPEAILDKFAVHATVELHSEKTRGQILINHSEVKKRNVTIINKINDEIVKEVLLKAAIFSTR